MRPTVEYRWFAEGDDEPYVVLRLPLAKYDHTKPEKLPHEAVFDVKANATEVNGPAVHGEFWLPVDGKARMEWEVLA